MEQGFGWNSDLIRSDYGAVSAANGILKAAAELGPNNTTQRGELAKVWEIMQQFIATLYTPEVENTSAWAGDECIRRVVAERPELAVNFVRKEGPISVENLYENWNVGDRDRCLISYTAERELRKFKSESKNPEALPGCCEKCRYLKGMEGHLPHGQARGVYGRR